MAGLDWREFNDISDRVPLNDLNRYLRARLPVLGAGSERIVYGLDSNTVLKVARDNKGTRQNFNEASTSAEASADVPIARVLRHDPRYRWLVSELVRPIKNNDEFERLMGYDVSDLELALEEMKKDASLGKRLNKLDYEPELWGAWLAVLSGNLAIIDVANVDHWGVTADGRPVLLDYGYTDEMYEALPDFIKR